MSVSTVTLAPLCENDCTSKTIRAYLQIAFSAGSYTTGGLPAGVVAYFDAHTIDVTQYLISHIKGETTQPSEVGFRYVPSTDSIQIFSGGSELANGASIPATVTSDTIVGFFIYNRL